jgi:hypothetical protein
MVAVLDSPIPTPPCALASACIKGSQLSTGEKPHPATWVLLFHPRFTGDARREGLSANLASPPLSRSRTSHRFRKRLMPD